MIAIVAKLLDPGLGSPRWLETMEAAAIESHRLRAAVASLRLTLGGTPGADVPEPIGCPCPGACATVAEIKRLRATKTPRWPRHKVSMHITHNNHLSYYETVERALECGTYDAKDFIDPNEMAAAIANNEVWEIQWYPDTPIGSYTVLATTFERAIEHARKIQESIDHD